MTSFRKKARSLIKTYVYHPFSWKKGFLVAILALLLGIIIPLGGILTAIVLYLPQLPDPELLEDYKPPLVSYVYSSDGVKIGEFAGQRRIWVSLDEVSPVLINALLAAEDKEFYNHWGVSLTGIMRAFYKNIRAGRIVQGASTITQQLSKNLFLTPEVKYSRKVKEALTSIMIERRYSKSEILELYLNQNFMGKGCYGVQAASQFYFDRDADSLTIEQAAFLAGLLQAPSLYTKRLKLAKRRRDQIINVMGDEKIIPPEFVDSLTNIPIEINTKHYESYKATYFVEHVRRYIQKKYGDKILYESGLKIYTTLDFELQKKAEKALRWKLDRLQSWNENIHHDDDSIYTNKVFDPDSGDTIHVFKKVQGSLVALEPTTGYVKAMIGGRDFFESQFNRATQALRQPGSAFKPFVYVAALDNGWQPSDVIKDTPETFPMEDGKKWRPKNYDGTYLGEISLRKALMKSRNLATIHLTEKVGPKRVAYYAKSLGIDSRIEPYLSIAMGASVVKNIDITAAYCSFPNGGIKVEPISILRIEDSEGRVLEQNQPERVEMLSEGVAYAMVDMMESVIDHGTGYGARLSGFERPAGGKTGTTNDCTDAWFIGFTPQLCTGVWIGYDEIIPLGEKQTGSRAALPVWTKFMLSAHEDYVVRDFPVPTDQVVIKDICDDSHLLATSRCPNVTKEVFITKNPVPEEYCPYSHRSSRNYKSLRKPNKGNDDDDFEEEKSEKDKKKSRL